MYRQRSMGDEVNDLGKEIRSHRAEIDLEEVALPSSTVQR